MKTKRAIIFCLCFSVVTLMTVGFSNLTVHIDGLSSAYAFKDAGGPAPKPISTVSEPSTLLLIGIGAAGVGAYSFARRRDRNKKDK